MSATTQVRAAHAQIAAAVPELAVAVVSRAGVAVSATRRAATDATELEQMGVGGARVGGFRCSAAGVTFARGDVIKVSGKACQCKMVAQDLLQAFWVVDYAECE